MEPAERTTQPQPRSGPPKVPGYELEGILGRGSTGVVYKGRQLAVDREVAVKVLHPELAQKARVVQRLQREARTTARLAHPHIVSAIDMGELDGVWWYAMEFVDGPTLGERLKQEGRLSEREALRLFIPLCEALVHAWEHGVVHRDIKPANILIDSVGGARLADLGLAFMDDDPSLTGSEGTLGTPHYMSPEQARSPADADVRSDIWSFGATLFHAVCGRTPFSGGSLAEVLSGVLYARVPDPLILEPSLSKGLALILRKCLSREPASRYQTPSELLADLELVRERRNPKVSRRNLDPVDRGRRGVHLAVLGGLALAAGAAIAVALTWSSGADGGLREPGTQLFAPLESLAERFDLRAASGDEAASVQLFALLAELGDMEAEVPDAERAKFIRLRTELRNELRAELSEILRSASEDVDALVRAEDYRGALERTGEELERQLFARTGFTVDALPDDQHDIALNRVGFLRSSIESGAAAAVASLRRVLEQQLAQVVFPQVDALQRAGRWRSARMQLELSDDELLELARFATARFPEELIDEELEKIHVALFGRRAELDADWGRLDQNLRRWVDARANQISQRLQEDRDAIDSPRILARAFELELDERGLREEELHPDGLPFARGELGARAKALAVLEDTLLEQRMREEFSVLRDVSRKWWGVREYEALRDRFDGFQARVQALAGESPTAWVEDLAFRTRVATHEAQLMVGVLVRAGEGVEALDGRTTRMRIGSITLSGEVAVPDDPLTMGFLFTPSTGVQQRVSLRTLVPNELEKLAGLRSNGAVSPVPVERLQVALFRYHEGDAEEANRVLRGGPVPTEGLDGELAERLAERISGTLGDREAERAEREERALSLLDLATGGQYERTAALGFVDQLLDEYGDLEVVRNQRSALRRLRDELASAPFGSRLDEVARLFKLERSGPGVEAAISSAGPDRVRMRFGFESVTSVWKIGEWIADGQGWVAPASDRLEGLLRPGPRLVLGPPLDPLEVPLEVTLRLEQLFDEGPPKCTVISIAGYHLALIGVPVTSSSPRWLLGSGPLQEFLVRIEQGEGQAVPALLKQGQRHELRFVVGQLPGFFEFQLDGRTITSGPISTPPSDVPAISIHAWQKVRLLSAEVVSAMR